MSHLLLTWSDRGVAGPRPGHQTARPRTDRGPVLRMLDQPESRGAYTAALVLATEAGAGPARALAADIAECVPSVEVRVLPIADPSDYQALFAALGPVVDGLSASRTYEMIDVVLSAGTPQMQTLWIILVQAGLLDARMVQVIPAAFVPSVHPRAIREVRLDIDGFPEIRALRAEVVRLRSHARILGGPLVGDSEPMRQLARRIARVAPTDVPVLVRGETGTGKELVARAVHDGSARASGPLVIENCGALAEGVLSSELFGHERGAFTGAEARKRGLFELAHGGTLVLDEVGEMPPRVQVSLLRVLQDGSLRRVGGERAIRVDVRVICATHRDLEAMVADGSFREDLYYRLVGASLRVPPLRQRRGDLDLLIEHFLTQSAPGAGHLRIARDAWRALEAYAWPGNVRELRAEVMRWRVFCDAVVTADDLSPRIRAGADPIVAPSASDAAAGRPSTFGDVYENRTLATIVGDAERRAVEAALARSGGNLSRAARALAIDRNTLKRKIRKHSVDYTPLGRGRPS